MATKWGIVGTGMICQDFSSCLDSLPKDEHQIVAVVSRSLESAKKFAQTYSIPKAYDSYEEFAKDKDIQVAYIGTVNNTHLELGKLMLNNGKHVLIEKPMTLTVKGTEELMHLARKKNLFLMEAIWSRFLPSYRKIAETIKEGKIGEVYYIDVKFGLPILHLDRIAKKSLGGGSIFDVGIYCINLVSVVYDNEKPLEVNGVGHVTDEGVDESCVASFKFSHYKTASITCSARVQLPNEAIIAGSKGNIKVAFPVWCPNEIVVNGEVIKFEHPEVKLPRNFTNSEFLIYEAQEVRKCLEKGLIESPILPLKDSVMIRSIQEQLLQQMGVEHKE